MLAGERRGLGEPSHSFPHLLVAGRRLDTGTRDGNSEVRNRISDIETRRGWVGGRCPDGNFLLCNPPKRIPIRHASSPLAKVLAADYYSD